MNKYGFVKTFGKTPLSLLKETDNNKFMEKEKSWIEAVYQVIEEENKEIDLQTIYEKVQKHRQLSSKDLEVTYHQPNFHHSVRGALNYLFQHGSIIRVERGLYKLK